MSKQAVLRFSAICAFGAATLVAQDASARSIRFDPGFEANPGSAVFIWDPQTDGIGFGEQIDLGFGFNFFGGVATAVQVNSQGELELLTALNGTGLGTITGLGIGAVSAQYGLANQDTNDPLPAFLVDGTAVAIADALRVTWLASNLEDLRFQSQIALFALANGDSLIEFNFFDQSSSGTGLNLSTSTPPIGLITPSSGTGVDLGGLLTGSPCLNAFGRDDGGNAVADCTAYYSSPGATAAGLPDPFRIQNGGTVNSDNAVADYRYLFRFPGTALPPPPTQVPEPATGLLLATGALVLLLRKRRSRGA